MDHPISVLLVVNPVAGRGRGPSRAGALREALGEDAVVRVIETSGPGQATEAVRRRRGAVDRVVAVGGDGTLNEVLRGLVVPGGEGPEPAPLAFLPAGTGNSAVRGFHLPKDPTGVARAVREGSGREVDVGMLALEGAESERPFLLWLGAGLDAAFIEALHAARAGGEMGLTGVAASAPHIWKALRDYAKPPIRVETDGAVLKRADASDPEAGFASVVVANVGELPFTGSVASGADPADGRLDVVGVPTATLLSTARLGARMLVSALTDADDVSHVRARRIVLRSEGEVPVQVDGEPVGRLPARVRVAPGALRLLGVGADDAANSRSS